MTHVKTFATTSIMFSLRLLGWLLLLLPTLALAAALPTVSRVKDINTTFNSSGSDPQDMVKIGNIIFFTAETSTTGRELWKSDGTAAGTVLVKDINAGSGGSNPDNLTAAGNVLYFSATDNGVHGKELWRSDGTAAGTTMVKDIYNGTSSAFCDNYGCHYPDFAAVDNVLYFRANNGIYGYELWRTDGTAAGTVLVKDINPGSNSSQLSYLTALGNVLYFIADNGVTGRELWKSDGTSEGTVLVKDIYQGSNDSPPNNFTAVGNVLYFRADNGVTGSELWKSDGTAAGTVLIKDIYAGGEGSYPYDLTSFGNMLYFSAYNGVNGRELWKSNGTAAGTVLVKDIRAGSGSSDPSYFTVSGTVLYFAADNGVTGYELWKYDGTAAGIVLVKDIYLGNCIYEDYEYPCNSYPYDFTVVGNTLYFSANNGVNGRELWKSDGTTAGTILVKDIQSGNGSAWDYNADPNLTAVGNTLYFSANNGLNGSELWKSDSTTAGTVLVKDINAGNGSALNDYSDLTAVGNVLYFDANNGVNGDELWKSDGTAAETVLVKDIDAGSGGSYPSDLTAVSQVLYFSAYNALHHRESWRSDGTEAGTILVKDINAGSGSAFCDYYYDCYGPNFTTVGNVLYFSANNGVTGFELWKSDGTAAGTVLVKDINPGGSAWDNYYDSYFIAVGNMLYFIANNGIHGTELWKSDGTTAGTVLVKDINAGSGSAWNWYEYPNFTAVGNILYFVANDGVHSNELWKSDGTAAGTVLVKDIIPGSYYTSLPDNLIAMNNVLYFAARNYVNGRELWKSNGTSAGTVLVKDIYPGNCTYGIYEHPCSSSPYDLTAVGNMLYFSANNGVNGYELWRSDGTSAGTLMVKDIWSGGGNANPYGFTTVGNVLYFSADNGINGNELWQTDGSTAGTQMKELVPGSRGSDPDYLTAIGTKLYFSAADDATGRELWRADIPNLFTVTPSANTGGFITSTVPQAVARNGTLKFTVTPLPTYNRNPTVGGTCPPGSWSASAISAPSVWTTGAITANCTVIFGFISTLPDFVVTAITLNPLTPSVNGTFTATITVKNQGAVAGDGKFLDVWSHQPVAQTCGAVGTKRVTVGTLTVGQSKAFTVTGLPAGTAGAKTLRAFVDSGCGTRESNEANNQMTKAYTVQ